MVVVVFVLVVVEGTPHQQVTEDRASSDAEAKRPLPPMKRQGVKHALLRTANLPEAAGLASLALILAALAFAFLS
jgi:hypothetical protein